MEQFANSLVRELVASPASDSAREKWEILRDAMHRTGLTTFGRKTLNSHDWFEAKFPQMTPVIITKCTGFAEYK